MAKIGHPEKAIAFPKWHFGSKVKIGHHAKAIAHANFSIWVKKLKFQKNTSQSILQIIYSCSVEETATKKDQILEK